MNSTQDVCKFIQSYTGVGFEVLPQHYLSKDLGVFGDDGAELIEGLAEEYGVDFSTFDAKKHFGQEDFLGIGEILRSLFSLRKPDFGGQDDIQVKDIENAVERGRWDFKVA